MFAPLRMINRSLLTLVAGLMFLNVASTEAQELVPPESAYQTPQTLEWHQHAEGSGRGKGRCVCHYAGWKDADTDGDNALTRAQAEQAGMQDVIDHFDRLDANRDNTITRDELRNAYGRRSLPRKPDPALAQ